MRESGKRLYRVFHELPTVHLLGQQPSADLLSGQRSDSLMGGTTPFPNGCLLVKTGLPQCP